MKRFLKVLSIVCVFAILSVSMAGCGGSATNTPEGTSGADGSVVENSQPAESSGPVALRFSWWGSDNRNKATLDVIEQYKKIAPNVTIEGEYMGANGYPEKLKTQLAARTAPDIMQSDAQWTDDLNRMGDFFVDLNQYKNVLDTSGFDPNFLKGFSMSGDKLKFLPTGINNLTFIFNSAVLDKVGIKADQDWNWDTLISEGKKVNQADSKSYFLCLGQTALHEVLRGYLRQKTGQQLIKDDYTLGFTREDLVDTLNYEKKLFDEKILQPADVSFSFNLQTVMQDPEWVNKQFAGTIDLTSVLGGIVEPFKDTVTVARFPIAPGATNSALQIKPAQLLGINNESKYPEEAAKFLNYFFNNKDAILTLKDTRSIQPTEAGRQYTIEQNVVDPNVSKAVELANAKPPADTAENGISRNAQIITTFVSAVEIVGFNKSTPEKAADDMISQLQTKLKQLKPAN